MVNGEKNKASKSHYMDCNESLWVLCCVYEENVFGYKFF